MNPEQQNRCYRRCKPNKRQRMRIKKRQAKRLEAMLEPALDSLSQLYISQPSSSRPGIAEAGLPSLAQLYISRPSPMQASLPASNESAIPPLMQLCLPSVLTQQLPMHSPLPRTPSPPPFQPPLPSSPPPPQPPPPPYDPPDENGNSGGETFENNNWALMPNGPIYTQNILAATYEVNLNFLRHYLQFYSQYSGLQN